MQQTIKQQLSQLQISPSFTRVKILEFLKLAPDATARVYGG
jgi:hypothetical protein